MLTTPARPAALADLGLLAARVVLGVVFIAHGAQKFWQWGIPGTTQSFGQMGVPAPGIAAPFVAGLELVGGIALILGLFTPVVGVLLAIGMLVAALLVHAPAGVFAADGGWELVGALGAGAIALAAVGAGRISLDHVIFGRRRRGHRAASPAASRATVDA